jgi:hypothetical protein
MPANRGAAVPVFYACAVARERAYRLVGAPRTLLQCCRIVLVLCEYAPSQDCGSRTQ